MGRGIPTPAAKLLLPGGGGAGPVPTHSKGCHLPGLTVLPLPTNSSPAMASGDPAAGPRPHIPGLLLVTPSPPRLLGSALPHPSGLCSRRGNTVCTVQTTTGLDFWEQCQACRPVRGTTPPTLGFPHLHYRMWSVMCQHRDKQRGASPPRITEETRNVVQQLVDVYLLWLFSGQ